MEFSVHESRPISSYSFKDSILSQRGQSEYVRASRQILDGHLLGSVTDCYPIDDIFGWYSRDSKLKENDIDIHRQFKGLVDNPVLVIADCKEPHIPFEAYCEVEVEVVEKGTKKKKATQKFQKLFKKVPSEILGVADKTAHALLLTDVNAAPINSTEVSSICGSLESNIRKLDEFLDEVTSQQRSKMPIVKVIVQDLVLQSIRKHYSNKTPMRGVIGVLYGSSFGGSVHVSKCYEFPIEDDTKGPWFWYLDLLKYEEMFSSSKQVKAEDGIVRWYRTGPKPDENDLTIHRLFQKHVPNLVLVKYDVNSTTHGTPVEAFCCVEDVNENDDSQNSQNVFHIVPLEIAFDEDEDIGLEGLSIDEKDNTFEVVADDEQGTGGS